MHARADSPKEGATAAPVTALAGLLHPALGAVWMADVRRRRGNQPWTHSGCRIFPAAEQIPRPRRKAVRRAGGSAQCRVSRRTVRGGCKPTQPRAFISHRFKMPRRARKLVRPTQNGIDNSEGYKGGRRSRNVRSNEIHATYVKSMTQSLRKTLDSGNILR